ncbi:hypothetical protein A3D07_02040 [Candidatus Curtissbacteria bacterium RIFCSPHIGHO2_02_FULL_42_15]|uniref:Sortase n=1 Tax=Candidatus Curtissbacteria bacterium RIFCSPHIGHO2_02_FULL_42_15 TaxID=1797716 RepID=A0A1F5GH51_9BACT|nr:MAG: hypothetical protein A3D07_02040 [Candidatus Curtissbacteria bacterium RIFCSPHIGHO2_02_FULL_42_15]
MAETVYIKVPPGHEEKKRKFRERSFSFLMLSIGVATVAFAAWPLLTWQFVTLPKLTAKVEEFPVPAGKVISQGSVAGANIQVVQEQDGFSYFVTDFQPQGKRPQEFLISIPKLEIEKAKVKVDAVKFDKYLALFPGSAIPGDVGNSFITGHSILPQFADPTNYKAIFTELPKLEIGDEVLVNLDDKTIRFVVQYSKVVEPDDLSVLGPITQNGRNLTLMTCVPPGTNTKRLVVVASLL